MKLVATWVSIMLAVYLAGCSVIYLNNPHPRLQAVVGGHPVCIFNCETAAEAANAEGGGPAQGGAITQSQRATGAASGASK